MVVPSPTFPEIKLEFYRSEATPEALASTISTIKSSQWGRRQSPFRSRQLKAFKEPPFR
jgi:hypothetical protein